MDMRYFARLSDGRLHRALGPDSLACAMIQQQFLDYLTYLDVDPVSGRHYAPGTVERYGRQALKYVDKLLPDLFPTREPFSIFNIEDVNELEGVCQNVLDNPKFIDANHRGNYMYSRGLNLYLRFAKGVNFDCREDSAALMDRPIPIDKASKPVSSSERTAHVWNRDRIKVLQIARGCGFTCQIDKFHQTFMTEAGRLYVEGHHIIPLSLQSDFECSLDCHANIIVLCPTCHRFFHYAAKRDRDEALRRLYDERGERLANSGISLDRAQFIEAGIGGRGSDEMS